MHDDTRVPPLPTSRGNERKRGAIISEGIIGRRKQKITGLRLVLFGVRGEEERECERRVRCRGEGGGETVGMRRGHVIVLGMIPNKDFTAVHDVCRNLNNKIPTMAPTANPTFSSAAGWLPAAYTRRRGRCKGRVVVTNCPAWIYLSRLLSRYQNETIIRGRRPTWNQLPL